MKLGRLLFPSIRWDADRGFEPERDRIERALEREVGGFIIFGGVAEAVRDLTAELVSRSPHPLLIGADLERGAGQQFQGATSIPPLSALGSLGDLEVSRAAGELTAREARALGVNWVYAPVADVDLEPRNPIVGSRAFGTDPELVAEHVAAWIRGCTTGGALSCAKHFPGHGRTVSDSHLELPRVDVAREQLEEDLLPFRAAIAAGVDSMMTAHVSYPALDPSGAPATLSRSIVTGLLRDRLGFRGLVVTDALIMEGVLEGGGEEAAAVRALAAGCDALLYPTDLNRMGRALDAAIGRELDPARVEEALARIEAAAARVAGTPSGQWGIPADRAWANEVADRVIHVVRGGPSAAPAFELLTIDDDAGGPFPPPPRRAFPESLRAAGFEVEEVEVPSGNRPLVVALYAEIRGWKGRPGLSAGAVERVRAAVAARADASIVLFGHPRLAAECPGANVVSAWGGEPLMQRAAARWLSAQLRPAR